MLPLLRVSQHKHFRSNSCQDVYVCVCGARMCLCISLSCSLFSYFLRACSLALLFSSVFANPKYVDTKLNYSFCLCGNKFRLLAEKMFLALDKAGFEMLPSVLNTPQIIVWKPLPSTGSQFAEKTYIKKKKKNDSIADCFHTFAHLISKEFSPCMEEH